MSTTPRFPSLDGLRAVSILFVIVHHLMGAQGTPPWLGRVAHDLSIGNLGVRIFFAISGFLITSLLLAERKKRGDVSLKRFYARRSLRLFPPLYAYLAVILGLHLAGVVGPVPAKDYVHAATYTMNWNYDVHWLVGHTWSLSVEEQFYLIWPALLLFMPPTRRNWLLVAVLIVVPVIRVGLVMGVFPGTHAFSTVADWLAAGALLALFRERLHAMPRYAHAIASAWTPPALVAVILASWTALGHWRISELTASLAVAGTVVLIDAVMTYPTRGMARVLNTSAMIWIGRISYSLYLWQELFCDRSSTAWYAAFPTNVALTFAAGALSYALLERPLERFRARLSAA